MEKASNGFNFGPIFIFIASLLWTTDAFVRSHFEGKLTAEQVVLLEHTIICIAISPLIYKYLNKMFKLDGKEWISIIIIGVGGSALATVALTEGFFMGDYPYQYVVQVVFLQQLQPIIAIGLAHLLLKERLPPYYYIFSLTGIFGAFLLVFADPNVDLIDGSTLQMHNINTFLTNIKASDGYTAAMLGLTAAALWGASTVFGRYMLENGRSKSTYPEMTTYRFFIAFIFLVILIPFYSRADGYPTPYDFNTVQIKLGLLYVALVVGLLSLWMYYYGLKTTKASISTIMELGYPLSFYVIIPFLNDNIKPNFAQLLGTVILFLSSTALLLVNNSIKSQESSMNATSS